MLDLQTAKDAYQSFEVKEVPKIKSEHIIADAWTKVKGFSEFFETIITGYLKHPIDQCIMRSKLQKDVSAENESKV